MDSTESLVIATFLAAATPLGLIATRHVIRRRRSSLIEDLHANLLKSEDALSTLEFARNKYGSASREYVAGKPRPYLISGFALLVASLPFLLQSVVGFLALLQPIDSVVGGSANASAIVMPALLWGDTLVAEQSNPSLVQVVSVAAAAFLGSYLFSLRVLLRATMNFELNPITWLRAAVHMVAGVVMSIIVFRTFHCPGFFPSDLCQGGGLGPWLAFAFLLGWIPDLGLMEIAARLNITLLKRIDSDALNHARTIPIEILDGIDYEVRYRLEEANISDVQNLATYNPILLFVETPYGLYESFDWVLQAQLCVIVGPARFLLLKRHNIRTVFDLERAVRGVPPAAEGYVRMIGMLLYDGVDTATLQLLGQAPATGGSAVFDAATLNTANIQHAVTVMLDDLHIHRLRQLWLVISKQLGREWLFQPEAKLPADTPAET